MVGNIIFLMIFAVFDPSPLNTIYKLQFLVLITNITGAVRDGAGLLQYLSSGITRSEGNTH